MAESGNTGGREELLKAVASRFTVEAPRVAPDRSVWISVAKSDLADLQAFLKREGFDHCSAISVTDWPDEDQFEITYHLWSYGRRTLVTVKTRIDRTQATVDSAIPLWGPSAAIHERELHELFGVRFEGNTDLAPLFLENWNGPPPFRKDFDWRKHVRETHYDEGDPRDRSYWDGSDGAGSA